VILPSSGGGYKTFQAPRQELVSTYSVEEQDEAALTEYLESGSYRRAVLARHLDSDIKGADYISTDSILYNRYQESAELGSSQDRVKIKAEGSSSSSSLDYNTTAIYEALRLEVY
jgi:hypothetical protein